MALSKEKLKEEKQKLKKELRNKVSGYVVGAFGLVAALAWNDAIITLINEVFPKTSNTLVAKFVYAAILTVVVVIVAVYLMNILADKDEKK